MSRRLASWLALAAAAAALSACGDGDDGTIPPDSASALKNSLDQVQSFRDSGECDSAAEAARQFQDQVNALPDTVGAELKQALREGGANLESLTLSEDQCSGATGATGAQGEADTTTADEDTAPVAPTDTEPQDEPPPDQGNDGGGQGDGSGGDGSGGQGGGGDNGTGGIGSGKRRG